MLCDVCAWRYGPVCTGLKHDVLEICGVIAQCQGFLFFYFILFKFVFLLLKILYAIECKAL